LGLNERGESALHYETKHGSDISSFGKVISVERYMTKPRI